MIELAAIPFIAEGMRVGIFASSPFCGLAPDWLEISDHPAGISAFLMID